MNIIEMANQSGWDDGADNINIEAFAALVAAHEREECAKLCETTTPSQINGYECADVIRARSGVQK